MPPFDARIVLDRLHHVLQILLGQRHARVSAADRAAVGQLLAPRNCSDPACRPDRANMARSVSSIDLAALVQLCLVLDLGAHQNFLAAR